MRPLFLLLLLSAVLLHTAGAIAGVLIEYDCSVTPDQADFSWGAGGNAGWCAHSGLLWMRTSYPTAGHDGIWFGWENCPGCHTLPAWSIPPDSIGLYVSVLMTLTPCSTDWDCRADDGSYRARIRLHDENTVALEGIMPGWTDLTVTIDTTIPHFYEMLLSRGHASYWIDGELKFSAEAQVSYGTPGLVIGDGSAGAIESTGELILNDVRIETGDGHQHLVDVGDPHQDGGNASILQVAPNPVGGQVAAGKRSAGVLVSYALKHEADVSLRVLDSRGRELQLLAHGRQTAGPHTTTWDGNASANPLPAGVYFVQLETGGESRVQKLVYLH
jgi:hypothetical protein